MASDPANTPPSHPDRSVGDRLEGRSIRIGLKVRGAHIVERLLPPDASLVFGAGGPGIVAVSGWTKLTTA